MNAIEAFARCVSVADAGIDLGLAAFLIAATRYPGLDVAAQLNLLDSLASGGRSLFTEEDDPLYCSNTLSQYLFDEVGFKGNRDQYYDPRNSYLNDVLERRLGIPISLSLLYIEVGRRLGVPLVGVGMPGHFLVRHRDVRELFIDPFFGGILLSVEECAERLAEVTGGGIPWRREHLATVTKRGFLVRMLRNLQGIYTERQDAGALAEVEQLIGCLKD